MQSDETIAISESLSVRTLRSGIFGINDVIHDFRADLLNEAACRDWVLKRLHPLGAYCPGCLQAIPEKSLQRFWNSGRVKCYQCNKFFDARTGTFLSGCQLSYREVMLLAILLSPDITDKIIADILDMSSANVRLWRNKFEAIEKVKNG
jgi:hypothetical protein